jgi:DNA processing protein
LFYKGDVRLLNEPSVAVIGTRRPIEPFISQGKAVASVLAQKFVIVSGLALGSDAIGHRASLDAGGKTIAVLPSPIDEIMPMTNKPLADEILQKGGLLVSEYGSGARFDKLHYIRRDRIQSLLSQSVFVIQADENSGAMYCVRKSLKDGKRVFDLQGNNNPEIREHIEGGKIDETGLLSKV